LGVDQSEKEIGLRKEKRWWLGEIGSKEVLEI
jgi:hypothetical protein